MLVRCESCGEVHEVEDALAPPSGTWPTCPFCRPTGNAAAGGGAHKEENVFDLGSRIFGEAIGDDSADADRDKTVTYQLSGLVNGTTLFGQLEEAAKSDAPVDELFGRLDDTAAVQQAEDDEAEAAAESSRPVQAEDIFALFGSPSGASVSEPALEAAADSGRLESAAQPPSAVPPAPPASAAPVRTPPMGTPLIPDAARLDSMPPLDADALFDGEVLQPAPGAAGLFDLGKMPTLQPGHPAPSAADVPPLAAAPGNAADALADSLFSSSLSAGAAASGMAPPAAPSSAAGAVPPPAAGISPSQDDLLASFGFSEPPSPAHPLESAPPAVVEPPRPSFEPLDASSFGLDDGDAGPSPAGSGSSDAGLTDSGFSSGSASAMPSADFGAPAVDPVAGTAPGASSSSSGQSADFAPGNIPSLELDLGNSGFSISASSDQAAHPAAPAAPRPAKISGPFAPAVARNTSVGKGKIVLFVLLVVLVAVILAAVWNFKGIGFQRVENEPPPAPVSAVIEEALRSRPELIGGAKQSTADELIQQGLSLLQNDTAVAYREARDSFIQALSVAPRRTDAMALYVEATLHVRPGTPYMDSCRALLDLALAESPDASLVHRVNAFLLMREEKEDAALAEADKAVRLALPEEQADALLMQGYVYLHKSAPVALEKIGQALQRNRHLKRAIYYQGLAAENSGDLIRAVKSYDERLAADRRERDSLQALVRVYLKLGRLEDARTALKTYLKAYPDDVSPKLWDAALSLRLEKSNEKAAASLRQLEKTLDRMTTAEKGLFHRLNAERLLGIRDFAEAQAAAAAAIELDERDGAAHYLAMKIGIAQRRTAEAKKHLEGCRRHLQPGLYQEFLGRLALMDGSVDDALAAFHKANEENPLRLTALLAEGILQMKQGNERAAWALHSRILMLDPYARISEPPSFDEFYEPEKPLLDEARRHLTKPASQSPASQWLYLIYGALAGFHSGDFRGSARALDQVISSEPTSLISFVYRAQMELDQKNDKKAKKFVDTALGFASRESSAWYMKAKYCAAQKDDRCARDAWIKVLELAPRHVDAEIQLARLSAEAGDKADAMSRLRRVLAANPHMEHVRAQLFELERVRPAR